LLLSPALIGNSKTALIATVAPLENCFDDSLCTMNFAASVKKIKTRPVINNKDPNRVVSELESEVKQLQSELAVCKTGEKEMERELLSAQALINSYKTSWEEALLKSKQSEMTRSFSTPEATSFTKTAGCELQSPSSDVFSSEQSDVSIEGYRTPSSGVESICSEVAQLQEAVSFTTLHSLESNSKSSENITRWLSQVEELRNTLEPQFQKKCKETRHSSAPASPPTSSADEVSQQFQCIKTEVVKTVQEELQYHLLGLKPHQAFSDESTACSSQQCSGPTSGDTSPRSSTSSASLTSPQEVEVSQEFQRLRADVLRIVQEQLDNHLHDIKFQHGSNGGSSSCSSGQSSGHMTPTSADARHCSTVVTPAPSTCATPRDFRSSEDLVAYRPTPYAPPSGVDAPSQRLRESLQAPPKCSATPPTSSRHSLTPSRSVQAPPRCSVTTPLRHRATVGAPVGTTRTPSPAPSRSSLVTQRHSDGLSYHRDVMAHYRLTTACDKDLTARPRRSDGLSYHREVMANYHANTVNTSCDKDLTARPCTPARASPPPVRRFVGPYPKVSWAYYEVPDSL